MQREQRSTTCSYGRQGGAMECRAEQVGVGDLYAEGMRLAAAGSLHEA